jgi:alcohol oxidase
VILSAGALSTPQILQRSGVGDRAKLESLGIECILDLPGVGQNYQDHQITGKCASFVDGVPDNTISDVLHTDTEGLRQFSSSDSLARNFVDTGIKLRPTEEEVRSMSPEFQKVWEDYFADKTDKPVMYIGMFSAYANL